MDHFDIVKRAAQLSWRYRALWVFGLVLAACGGGSGSDGNWNFGHFIEGDIGGPGIWQHMPGPTTVFAGLMAFMVMIVVIAVVAGIVGAILVYVSETSLMRGVDDHERQGVKHSFRQLLSLGWSRRAFRLFLIDLVVQLPLVIVFVVLGLMALVPLLGWATDSEVAGWLGTSVSVFAVIAVAMLAVLAVMTWALLKPFVWRAAAIEGHNVFDSLRRGYRVVRARLKDSVLAGLVMAGLHIAYGLVAMVVMLAFGLAGLLAGGVLGGLTYWLVSLLDRPALATGMGFLFGVPIIALVVAIPALAMGTLWAVFRSSYWTMTYHEISR